MEGMVRLSISTQEQSFTLDHLYVAASIWHRTRGLLGRKPLHKNEGLLLQKCKMIHTLGMRHAIDIVFISANGEILKIESSVKPMRLVWCWKARAAIELLAGNALVLGLRLGDTLVLSKSNKPIPV